MCICCRLFMHAVEVHRAAANVCTSSVGMQLVGMEMYMFTP